MIRKSTFVAVVAIALSVLVHLLGLRLSAVGSAERPAADNAADTVALGNAFEDLAETVPEPPEPDPAETPEPPVETPATPEPVEVPVSDALVASSDPQKVTSPDVGPASAELTDVPPPEVTDPVALTQETREASDQADETPKVQPTAETPPAQVEEEISPVSDATDEPEQIAALPAPSLPISPEIQSPAEAEVPDIPVEAPEVESQENEESPEAGTAGLAVTTSIRPRLPDQTDQSASREIVGRPESFDNLKFPDQEIDSPLTTYRRKGIDAFTRGGGTTQSGGRGPGNSNVTNYAGRVLVHLNRTRPVYVSARGFAKVFFEINPDGTLAWVDIVDSSGSPDVDRAAKEQVRRASPFPKPPGGVSRKLSFYFQNG